MKYLIDTSVIVGYLRDKPKKRELIKKLFSKGDLTVSIITYGELEYGARKAGNYSGEKEKIKHLFADLGIEILSLTEKTMQFYAKVKRNLELKGSGLDDFDLLMGAAALENDIALVTDNRKHFNRIPGLTLFP